MAILEYDGSRYHGSQYQDNACTIQGEVELALEKLTGRRARVAAASRTDAGVHAKGQVVSFRSDLPYSTKVWVNALNFHLARDIAVRAVHEVNPAFDVRRDASSREYRYSILNRPTPSPLSGRFTCFVPQGLDVDAMNEASHTLVGEHDFAPFTAVPMGGTHRRVFKAEVARKGDLVVFDMEASSFLPHQVRNTIGGLMRVGLQKMGVEAFRGLAQSRRPGSVGPSAPAKGLCLMKVNYRDFPPAFEEK